MMPLSEGPQGTAESIDIIRELVNEGTHDPTIRRTATDIMAQADAPSFNDPAEIAAIWNWVRSNIYFRKDGLGVGHGIERLQPASQILKSRAADCDCFVILLASMLGSVGYETRVVTINADQEDPCNFTHIWLEAKVNGQWVAMDPARPDARLGLAPTLKNYSMVAVWPLTGGSEMLNGLGAAAHSLWKRSTLSNHSALRRGMGQDGGVDWTGIGQQAIATAPAILGGVAQIVSASNLPGGVVNPYATTTLPASTPGVSLTAGGSSTLLILAILGVAALFAMKKS